MRVLGILLSLSMMGFAVPSYGGTYDNAEDFVKGMKVHARIMQDRVKQCKSVKCVKKEQKRFKNLLEAKHRFKDGSYRGSFKEYVNNVAITEGDADALKYVEQLRKFEITPAQARKISNKKINRLVSIEKGLGDLLQLNEASKKTLKKLEAEAQARRDKKNEKDLRERIEYYGVLADFQDSSDGIRDIKGDLNARIDLLERTLANSTLEAYVAEKIYKLLSEGKNSPFCSAVEACRGGQQQVKRSDLEKLFPIFKATQNKDKSSRTSGGKQ